VRTSPTSPTAINVDSFARWRTPLNHQCNGTVVRDTESDISETFRTVWRATHRWVVFAVRTVQPRWGNCDLVQARSTYNYQRNVRNFIRDKLSRFYYYNYISFLDSPRRLHRSIELFNKFARFLAMKFLYFKNFYFTKLVWHHLIEQSFSFQNLFYKLR